MIFLRGILVSLGEMRLGKTLRTLRRRRGWTQVALAKKARITQGYLARVEGVTGDESNRRSRSDPSRLRRKSRMASGQARVQGPRAYWSDFRVGPAGGR